MPKTEKRKTGDLGEKIAGRFLSSKGFEIIGWNYLKPWGEIDIIAKKKGKTHFVEVKTVTDRQSFVYHKTGLLKKAVVLVFEQLSKPELAYTINEVLQETEKGSYDEFRPEDNLHPWKLKRLKRAIQSYLAEKRMSEEDDWQFDAVTVRLNEPQKIAKVEYLEDIIL